MFRKDYFFHWSLALALSSLLPLPAVAFYHYPTSDDFLSPPDRSCAHPAPAPDGRSIAYVVQDSGLKQLWLRTLAKPPVDRKLSDGQANDDTPDWSPDGTKLYFTSDRGGTSKIWVMDVGRGTRRAITSGIGQDFHPRISPSGRKLAFDSNRSGNYEIWIRDLTTGDERKLTDSSSGDFSPCWSPGEDRIAFTSSRGGRFDIWIQEIAGSNAPRPLTKGKGSNAHPDWSPDGSAIAFDSDRAGTTKVFVVPAGGSIEPIAVTDLLSVEEWPRFTKTGRRIVFAARENQLAGFKAKPVPQLPLVAALPPAPKGATPRARPGPARIADATVVRRSPRLLPPALAAAPVQVDQSETDELAPEAPQPARKPGGLAVLQFFPVSSSEGSPLEAPIGAVFSRPLDPGQKFKSLVRMWESTAEVSLEAAYNPSLKRLEIMPDFPLRHGAEYRIALARSLRARDGSTLGEPFTWNFVAAEKPVVAARPLMSVGRLQRGFLVAERLPSPKSGGHDAAAKVKAGFTLPIDAKSLDSDSLRLYTAKGETVPGELYFPPGDHALQLTPYTPLEPGTVYEVRVSDKVRAADGDALGGSRSWRFRTAFKGALRVVKIEPEKFLPERPQIRLRFNRPVAKKSLGDGKVLLQGTNFPYPGAARLESGNETLVFEPYQKLPDRENVVLFLPVDLTDADGNSLELAGPISFTTKHDVTRRATPPPAAPTPPSPARTIAKASKASGSSSLLGRYLHAGDPLGGEAEPWMIADLGVLARRGHVSRDFAPILEMQGGKLSRYKAAQHVQEALRAFSYMKPPERERARRLAYALGPELASLGVRLDRAVAGTPARPQTGDRPRPPASDLDSAG